METKSLKLTEFYWYWMTNGETFESIENFEWEPYDIVTSHLIEENYKIGNLLFEIEIQNKIYCINLSNQFSFSQFNKIDTEKIRQIARVKDDYLRKNRLTDTNEASSFDKKLLESYEYIRKDQVKIKVCDLFGDPENNKFVYDSKNILFNTEISISSKKYEELKKKFYNKVILNDLNGVIKFLKKDIESEAKQCKKTNKHNHKLNCNYIEQAEIYKDILDKKQNLSFEEKLLFLYSLEGFLYHSLNSFSNGNTNFDSFLHLYFILMLASLKIVSIKNYSKSLSHFLNETEGYFLFYRGAKISDKFLLEKSESFKEEVTSEYIVNNEFLSTTCDFQQCQNLIFQGKKEDGIASVLFTYKIKKESADQFKNFFCYVGNISNHPQEKEVLFFPLSIFKIEKIIKHESGGYYQIILDFIPETQKKKYDYLLEDSVETLKLYKKNIDSEEINQIVEIIINYEFLQEITLGYNDLGDEGAKIIAELLKTKKSLKKIDLFKNKIKIEGAKALAEAIKINETLEYIRMDENQLGNEGAIAFADALNINTTLEKLELNMNEIGDAGAQAFAEVLKVNNSLKRIDLSSNLIQDEGAIAIGKALNTNKTLQRIDLMANEIGEYGSIVILKALMNNKTLEKVDLQFNKIGNETDLLRKFFGYRIEL